MIVVVEDLRNVEFNLILVDKKSKFKLKRNSSQAQKSSPAVPMLEYHSFPLPRITGSRSSLKVHNGLTSILKENSWIYFSQNMTIFAIFVSLRNEFYLRIVMKTLIYRNEIVSSEISSTFIKNFCSFYKAYWQQKKPFANLGERKGQKMRYTSLMPHLNAWSFLERPDFSCLFFANQSWF